MGRIAVSQRSPSNDAVRAWFEDLVSSFPGQQIKLLDVTSHGRPWVTTVAVGRANAAPPADGKIRYCYSRASPKTMPATRSSPPMMTTSRVVQAWRIVTSLDHVETFGTDLAVWHAHLRQGIFHGIHHGC